MKITSVDVIRVETEGKVCPGWAPICVRINTDEGICGYGEAGISVMSGGMAVYHMLKDLCPMIIGMDPRNNEEIWEFLYHASYWGQGGGVVIFAAISAIDIACWDIKGKYYGAPVYQLIGGRTNPKIRAYASQIQLGWGAEGKLALSPEDFYREAKHAVDEGYTAVKADVTANDPQARWTSTWGVKVQKFPESPWQLRGIASADMLTVASERIAAIREAVGPNGGIILEMHGEYDANTAIQLAQVLDKYNCLYFEEPVSCLNPAMTSAVAASCRTPIATGERIFTRWGFKPFLDDRTLRVAQPDVAIVGGITEAKKVCDYARVNDIGIQFHNMCGPIASAAALHLETAIPNFIYHEDIMWTRKPGYGVIGDVELKPKDGYYSLSDRPGLGVELSEQALSNALITRIE